MKKILEKVSRAMSFFLRHNSEKLGITLDSQGWTDLPSFMVKLRNEGVPVTEEIVLELTEIDKERFSVRHSLDHKTGKVIKFVRANQGHSCKGVAISHNSAIPTALLYHGTKMTSWSKIRKSGAIHPMKRHHVHLTDVLETAENSATRWKNETPVLLGIDAVRMHQDGHQFYLSDNGVWLIAVVPVKYITELKVDF